MINSAQLSIKIFYKPISINIFKFNNILYEKFNDYLSKYQPKIIQNSDILCVWDTPTLRISYSSAYIELTLLNNIDKQVFKNIVSTTIDSLSNINIAPIRIGIVSIFYIDDKQISYFLDKVDNEIKSAPEYNISWLKQIKKNNVFYNVWTVVQQINEGKRVIYDANSKAGQDLLDFESTSLMCFELIYSEVKKWDNQQQ